MFARFAAALTVAAAALSGVVLVSTPADAATCGNVMTFQFDPTNGLVLSPSKLTVAAGACVTLQNATITSAQFTVGSTYKQTAAAFSNAVPDYVVRQSS